MSLVELSLDHLLERAIAAHRQGDENLAEDLYRRVLAMSGEHRVARFNLGMIGIRKQDPQADEWVTAALTGGTGGLAEAEATEAVIGAYLATGHKFKAEKWLAFARFKGFPVARDKGVTSQVDLPAHLAPMAFDHMARRELRRYAPFESARYVYAVDVVGGCNLRCPTCPVANRSDMPKGFMAPDNFERIIDKIVRERGASRPDIWLFNWSEPLLHRDLPRFIRYVRQAGLTSLVSSNLQVGKRIEAVIEAAPDRFKVSLSSLRQDIYGKTHFPGDISKVIENLRYLAEVRDRHRVATEIWIGHHLYRNTLEEQEAVSRLARELGFGYRPSAAIMAPIEKVLDMQVGRAGEPDAVTGQLITDPVSLARESARHRSGEVDCELRFNMTAIGHDGSVSLCCGTTQSLSPVPGRPIAFLEWEAARIEEMKYRHAFCATCMKNNLHLAASDV